MRKRYVLVLSAALAAGLFAVQSLVPVMRVASAQAASAPAAGTDICGQPVLNSPYDYTGAAGPYDSGTAGLPTFGAPGTDFPGDTAGIVLPPETNSYASYQLKPDALYYLEPGYHYSSFAVDAGDSFVGGYADGIYAVVDGQQGARQFAFDINSSNGDQTGVAIEYLTVQNFSPPGEGGAIDQSGATGWTIEYDTITHNVPGAGAIATANSTLEYDCMSFNGQYGFQSSERDGLGMDTLTQGPYNVTIENNEIAYNDTCDWEGTLNNPKAGWSGYDPVPSQYRPSGCGPISPDGNSGGFKLWRTNGVTVAGNYIHDNYGPGGWADTDNANTTVTGNYFSHNDGAAWVEEISYNFRIDSNTMVDNGWVGGLGNSGFPTAAVYISESGSDTTFGGVPACQEASCSGQPAYQSQSYVTGNTLTDNSGSVFLWENSNRFCNDGSDDGCPLVAGGETNGAFTSAACKANLPTALISSSWQGEITGSPAADYWDGCRWKTENVSVEGNTVNYTPSHIPECNTTAWPDCGATGMFSVYASTVPYNQAGGWVIPSALTFHQGNTWSGNTYNGPVPFFTWNQGDGDNPVGWSAWSGALSGGDQCMSSTEEQSGYCVGPFGQDSGSTYNGSGQGGTVSYDSTGPGSSGASCADCSTLSWTHTVSGSSTALLVAVSVGGNSTQTVSVTDNGTPMTAQTIPLNTDDQSSGFLQVFGLAGVPAGTNAITVTAAGEEPVEITGGSESFDNVNQSDPFGPTLTSYGSGTVAGITTDDIPAGDMIAGFAANGSPIDSVDSPAVGQYTDNYSNDTGAGNSAGATWVATGGNVTMTWNLTDDWWTVAALQVNASQG